jgi:hypothetical protein
MPSVRSKRGPVHSPRIRPVRGVAWSGTVPCLSLAVARSNPMGGLKCRSAPRAGKTPVQARQRVGLTRWAAPRSAQLASRRSCPPASAALHDSSSLQRSLGAEARAEGRECGNRVSVRLPAPATAGVAAGGPRRPACDTSQAAWSFDSRAPFIGTQSRYRYFRYRCIFQRSAT